MSADRREPATRVICAWCGRLLQDGDGRTSHGLCDECLPRVVAAVEQQIAEENARRHTDGEPGRSE